MRSWIEALYIAASAGEPMRRVKEVEAIEGRGLAGDRYAVETGYYCPHDVCEVTLIEGEALDVINAKYGIAVLHGEHRRNIVTRGLPFREIQVPGQQVRIGEVVLEYNGPRPPCGYVERITEKGMTRALGEGAGICARVLSSGTLREGAEIVAIEGTGRPRRQLP
jgi:MOSC domain-containing protein YiiM